LCTNSHKFCGYSNCFRPFYKMRGFMPCCEYHYKHPKKWGEDGMTFTGSVFHKRRVNRMNEVIEPQVPKKHKIKEKLQAIIDTYPEILDPSKLELSEDGRHIYIRKEGEQEE